MTRCSTVCFLNVKQHIHSQLLPDIFGSWIPRAFEWDNTSFSIETYWLFFYWCRYEYIIRLPRWYLTRWGSFIKAHLHHERFRDDIVDFTSIFIASNPWILMNQIAFRFCWQLFKLHTFRLAFFILHLKYYLFLQSLSANICWA